MIYTKRVTKTAYQYLIKLGYPEVFSISGKVSDTELFPTYGEAFDFLYNRYNVLCSVVPTKINEFDFKVYSIEGQCFWNSHFNALSTGFLELLKYLKTL